MSVARIAILTFTCVACIRSSSVVCNDAGAVCPAGTDCVPLADSGEFACVGAEPVCGNGVLEPFAVLEGVAVVGETCDDGNLSSHDGCDGRCGIEQARWRQRVLEQPEASSESAMVYDGHNEQFVLFGGGLGQVVNADTWLGTFVPCASDGLCLGWEKASPTNAPLSRRGAAMAYDSDRRRVVLFGGVDSDQLPLFDTWEWDGVTWTQAQPSAVRPQARSQAAMTYDHVRRRVILHGGTRTSGVFLGDTWEWDGFQWTETTSSVAPPTPGMVQQNHVTAYDPVRGVTVLFGVDAGSNPITYEYDGAWIQRTPNTSPPPRFEARLVFDPIARQVMLVGGRIPGGPDPPFTMVPPDAWTWDGTTWIRQPDLGVQAIRAAVASDPVRGRVILIGGLDSSFQQITGTLIRDGQWVEKSVVGPNHADHAATYDAVRGQLVVQGDVLDGQTWVLDRSTWVAVRSTGTNGATMAFDSRRHIPFVFGGDLGGGTLRTDTLSAWDGSSWIARAPTGTAPVARAQGTLAYDERRDRLVLFGGTAANNVLLDDFWEWDEASQTWTESLTDGAVIDRPTKRSCHVMGYDPIRDQLVLFGGRDDDKTLNDTWVFDSTLNQWSERLSEPPARCDAAMTWSYARGRLTMFGGQLDGVRHDDTWEWDGFRWQRVFADSAPPARAGHVLVASDKGVMLTGGDRSSLGGASREVWELRYESSIAEDSCRDLGDSDADGLAGCDDPDCRWACFPLCSQADELICASDRPTCGDGVHDPLETCRSCPADALPCPIACGDFFCDPGEDCPGDCP